MTGPRSTYVTAAGFEVDTNRDGTADWIVFSYDSGAIRSGSFNGLTEVWLYEVATDSLYASGFLATAPTDSNSIVGVSVQDVGTFTGGATVDSAGVVSLGAAAPVGNHTIVIAAEYSCTAVGTANLPLGVARAAQLAKGDHGAREGDHAGGSRRPCRNRGPIRRRNACGTGDTGSTPRSLKPRN